MAATGKWKETPIHQMGYAPDLPPNTPGIIADSTNLVPNTAGVATLPIGVQQIAAEGSAIQTIGTFAGQGLDGAWRVFKGTRQHLFRAASPYTAWTEFDNSQTFVAPADAFWSFALQSVDVYATNGTDAVQKSAAGGQFQALTAATGSVPLAKFSLIVQPGGYGWFLVLFNLTATDSSGWASSGVNDDTDWGYDVATLGATGFLRQTPGGITGAATVRGGVVAFKPTSLYYGTLVGPPSVWSYTLVSSQVGAAGPLCQVNLGDQVAFVGPDDFYLFDGYSLQPIPNNLRSWFFANVNYLIMPTIQGRYDQRRDCVFWHFALNGSTTITDWICWHRKSGRWTHGKLSIWFVYSGLVPRSTTAYDTMPAYVSTSGALYNYPPTAGTDTVSTLTTWDIGADDDSLITIQRAKPHWKTRPTGSQSLTSVVKAFPGTTGSAGTSVSAQDTQDFFDFVQTARWQTLTFSFAGDAALDSIGLEAEWAGVQ